MSKEFNLMGSFKEVCAKEGWGKENKITVTMDTGIDLFDWRNGKVEDNNILTGLNTGKIFTIAGKSGTAKSTICVQAGWNMIKDIPNAIMQIWDYEASHSMSRLAALTKTSEKGLSEKIQLLNEGISVEKMYSAIRGLAEIKINNFDSLAIDSGRINENGEPHMILPPSIILIDSWSMMCSDAILKLDETELNANNMVGAQQAKLNNIVINSLVPVLQRANISLFLIAHITKKVETGPVKTAAQINYRVTCSLGKSA